MTASQTAISQSEIINSFNNNNFCHSHVLLRIPISSAAVEKDKEHFDVSGGESFL